MKKYIWTILTLFVCAYSSTAQHSSIFNVDSQNYPLVRANFYAFDKEGKQQLKISKEELEVKEQEHPQEIVKVTHPHYQEPKPISLVLSGDVSGSMKGPNMKIAKAGMKSIIDWLPLDYSETALTSFDHNNYINSDFSKDANRLYAAVDNLSALGGTDYDLAFNNPLTGALELARGASYKKVLVFLTDGLGKGNQSEIINKALSLDVVVYCITVNMDAPEVLKNIAKSTGGNYFENINTVEKAQKVFQRILFEAQELKPSTIEWKSEGGCGQTRDGFFEIPKLVNAPTPYKFVVPSPKISQLKADLRYLELSSLEADTTITLEAVNSSFTINSFESKLFKLKEPKLPFTLKKGHKKSFILSPDSAATGVNRDKILLYNNHCEPLIVMVSLEKKRNTPIQVEFPNGNEVLYAGMDTLIDWSGTQNPVFIELSDDGGGTWNTVIEESNNRPHQWKIPDISSDKVLIRATKIEEDKHIEADATGKICDVTFPIRKATFIFSPDKTKLICQDLHSFKNKIITVHDFSSGELLHSFEGDNSKYASFSKDGASIYMISKEGNQSVLVYDAHSFQLVGEFPKMKKLECVNSANTHYLHKAHLDHQNSVHQYINLKTGKVESHFKALNLDASTVKGNLVAGFSSTIEYARCEIWDMKKKEILFHVDTKIAKMFVKKAELTDDKRFLIITGTLSASDLDPNHIEIYDVKKQELIFAEKTRGSLPTKADVSSSNRIFRVNANGNCVLQDIATGQVYASFDKAYLDGNLSPMGKYVVLRHREVKSTSYTRQLFKIKVERDSVDASDVSDAVFTIIQPKLRSIDVQFGKIILGESADQVVGLFLHNPYKIDVPIKQIYIEGKHAGSFSLVSGKNSCILKSEEKKDVEFRFSPLNSGLNEATICIATAYDTIKQKITGIGASPGYALAKDLINFGRLNVGSTKDSLITNILKNTGKETLKVRFVKIIGPDKQQFALDLDNDFQLKAGESKSVKVTFKPVLRGKTSSRIFFEVENVVGYQVVEIFAEGVAPKRYQLNGKTVNKLNGMSMSAKVTCTELQSDKNPFVINTDTSGAFQFQLNADRIYVLKAEKMEFTTTIDTLDLSVHSASKFVKRDLIIAPPKGSEPVPNSLVIYGKILDGKTNFPLVGTLTYYDETTNEKLGQVKSDSLDGTYRLVLDLNRTYHLITESREYFPVSKVVDTVIEAGVKKIDFLLFNVMAGETIKLEHVLFVIGKSDLMPESYPQLDLLSSFLLDNESVKIELSGHTDNSGSAKLNQKLSEERVTTIKKYLIEKGVPKNRISGTGYGGRKPIANNKHEETRRLNRRVEFKVKKK